MSDPQQQPQKQTQAHTLEVLTALMLVAFADATTDLIKTFASLIGRYVSGDILLFKMRQAASNSVARLLRVTPALVTQIVDAAALEGAAAGGPPGVATGGLTGESFESHAQRSARAIREDLDGKINQLGYRITRFADDAYQAVTADAALGQVLGLTPAQAQHAAYNKLLQQGITGFVDSKGRNWELQAYVDMAVRTAAQRAYNVSHLDRMLSLGIDLFTVTDDGHPCPLCEPWQGRVLSVEPDARADATIADATAAGLFHPRCRHTLVGFFPGVTVVLEPHLWNADDQAAYNESQQQRALERAIRAAKRRLDGAFTPEMKSAAQLAVRRAQANMRDFIERTGRVRIPRREQLTL